MGHAVGRARQDRMVMSACKMRSLTANNRTIISGKGKF